MFFSGRRARARAEELLSAIYAADDGAPMAAMEELVALARSKPAVKKRALKDLEALLIDGGDPVGVAWCVIAAGELGREGALLALLAAGRWDEEERIPGEAVVPVLVRHGLELLHEILREIHRAEDVERRALLYESLKAALVPGDGEVRERLRLFALERWEVERRDPEGLELVHRPLFLLAHLADGRITERIAEARVLCQRGDLLDRNLNDVELVVRGEADFLEATRQTVREDWRATARNLEKALGLVPLEVRG